MRQIPFSEQMVEKMNIWRTEIASKTYGTTMSNEYLPKDIKKMPILPAKNFMQATDGTQIDFTPIQYTSVQQEYRIDLPVNTTVIFSLFYFPGWKIKVDGRSENIIISGNGLISAQIPKGNHLVELRFENTPIRLWSNLISLLSMFIIAGLIASLVLRKRKV